MKEKNNAKEFNDGINIAIVNNNLDKLPKEDFVKAYGNNVKNVKNNEAKNSFKDKNEVKLVNDVDDVVVMKEDKSVGCFGKIIEMFTPDYSYIRSDQKKHNWFGVKGAFDKKFKDTRDYQNS